MLEGSSRSKSAALCPLRRMLLQLIYKALEQRMEEDWTEGGVAPGATAVVGAKVKDPKLPGPSARCLESCLAGV